VVPLVFPGIAGMMWIGIIVIAIMAAMLVAVLCHDQRMCLYVGLTNLCFLTITFTCTQSYSCSI
jgi:hypothetical protein